MIGPQEKYPKITMAGTANTTALRPPRAHHRRTAELLLGGVDEPVDVGPPADLVTGDEFVRAGFAAGVDAAPA
ncbi:hypothetical protein ABIB25_000218 [Nakamurella sp. UYEF19]|uniref:hypothetical protein n=1 Tax=Nakamurella sp. UYEF19 TaxID=1756392 RepID=UPI003392AF81